MAVHSDPLMTPMFLMERMVKKRSLSALSFQFLFIAKATRLGRNQSIIAVKTLWSYCLRVQIVIGKEIVRDGGC